MQHHDLVLGGHALNLPGAGAAYTPRQYAGPAEVDLPPGQAADPVAWRGSLRRVRSLAPAGVHFCHHTDVLHGG